MNSIGESWAIESGGHPKPLSETSSVRHRFLQYGRQSSAYFLFQPGVERFAHPYLGDVYYMQQKTPLGAVNIVYIDPLCEREHMDQLIDAFLQQHTLPTVFVGVTSDVANPLRERGYHVNHFGLESRIELASFTVQGKKKKQLRHASHFGERTGAVVKELSWDEVDQQQVQAVSRHWLHTKDVRDRELHYLTRPPVFGDEWLVRKFYCIKDEKILGYVFFDPYYEEGELVGYCANILRAEPDKESNGALDFIILEAMKTFRREGLRELSLGMAPLYGVEEVEGDRKLVRNLAKGIYNYGNDLYAFKGLAYHKSRYRPIETPWYICTKDISLFRLVWAMAFGMGVLGKQR